MSCKAIPGDKDILEDPSQLVMGTNQVDESTIQVFSTRQI